MLYYNLCVQNKTYVNISISSPYYVQSIKPPWLLIQYVHDIDRQQYRVQSSAWIVYKAALLLPLRLSLFSSLSLLPQHLPPTLSQNNSTTMISALRTSAVRAATRRPMSTATPKMHKAKDTWGELSKTRPPPGHDHVSIK